MTITNKNELVRALSDANEWDKLFFEGYDPQKEWDQMRENGLGNAFDGFNGLFSDAASAALKNSDITTAMTLLLNTLKGTILDINAKTGFLSWDPESINIQASWIRSLGNSSINNTLIINYENKIFEIHEMNKDDFIDLLNNKIKNKISSSSLSDNQKNKLLVIIEEVNKANHENNWSKFSKWVNTLFSMFAFVSSLITIGEEVAKIL